MTPRICVSIMGESVKKMEEKARLALALGADIIEFRLDSLRNLNSDAVKKLVSEFSNRCILTLRPRWEGGFYDGDEEERLRIIFEVSEVKPAYIDIELKTKDVKRYVKKLKNFSKLIVSLHDCDGKLSESDLRKAALKAMELGDYAKIITTAGNILDNVKVLSLYNDLPRERLIAFAMGELGIISRILSPIAGAPIVYTCLPGEQAAPGQLSIVEMKKLLKLVELC